MASADIIVVLWEWGPETKFAGGRFWAAHGTESDGRLRDWPKEGLIARGAAKVAVAEGEGLDLLEGAAAP